MENKSILLRSELMNNKFDNHHQLIYRKMHLPEVCQKITLQTVQKLDALCERLPAAIFLFALIHSPFYPNEISRFFSKSRQTIHYNIQKLCATGILKENTHISQPAMAVIQKKARSRQDGTRKLSFYSIEYFDEFLLGALLNVCLEVIGLEEAKKIAAYTRNFQKPDYRIEEAIKYLRRFTDMKKRDSAIMIWAKDLKVTPSFLRSKLEGYNGTD